MELCYINLTKKLFLYMLIYSFNFLILKKREREQALSFASSFPNSHSWGWTEPKSEDGNLTQISHMGDRDETFLRVCVDRELERGTGAEW